MTAFSSKVRCEKFIHRGSRSPKYVELGHFTFVDSLQIESEKCTEIQNARAESLLCCPFNPFVW